MSVRGMYVGKHNNMQTWHARQEAREAGTHYESSASGAYEPRRSPGIDQLDHDLQRVRFRHNT